MSDQTHLLRRHDSYDADGRATHDNLPTEQATLVEVARGLNATVRLVQALHNEVKDFAVNQATLRHTINSMEETMKELRKAITATDPASLTIRLVIMEREIETYKEWKKDQETKALAERLERDRAGMQLKVAITASVMSFIGSMGIMILSLVLKH
jgi:hypothetical protein